MQSVFQKCFLVDIQSSDNVMYPIVNCNLCIQSSGTSFETSQNGILSDRLLNRDASIGFLPH